MDIAVISQQLEHVIYILQGILQLNLALLTLTISMVIVYIFYNILKSFAQ